MTPSMGDIDPEWRMMNLTDAKGRSGHGLNFWREKPL